MGGVTAVLAGGKFGHGFIAAGAGGTVGGKIGDIGGSGTLGPAIRTVARTILGGTISKLTGGKFANGAGAAAFASLMREVAQRTGARSNAQKGGIDWQKQAGATDADLAEAKRLWALAKTRRLVDGSIPNSVQGLLDLENGSFKTTILVGSTGNSAAPDSITDAMNVNVGSAGTIKFNPWKVGSMGGGIQRSPEASLVHEAYHVRQFNTGALQSFNMRQHAEVGATSVENWHRKAMGLPQRSSYGNWPVAAH